MRLSRRTVLLGGMAVTGSAVVAGGSGYWLSDPLGYARGVLAELAGPVEVSDGDLAMMVELARSGMTERRLRLLIAAGPARELRESWREDIEGFRRRLLTELVCRTDYRHSEAGVAVKVVYLGEVPCNNPFMRV